MYATDAEILAVMQFWHPEYTSINTTRHELATSDVDGNLIDFSLDPLDITADLYGLLKSAEILYYLERAAMAREIESVFSNVRSEQIGKSQKSYDNSIPMFFFASGSPKPFLRLIPHETYRMQAFAKITQFIQLRFKRAKGRFTAAGVVEDDTTDRGYDVGA